MRPSPASTANRPTPPAALRLACQLDPERWFDRANRTEALAACLNCPARRWCAGQALRQRAFWGMWAGIWIDGHLADVAPYLRAIAASPAGSQPRGLPVTRCSDRARVPELPVLTGDQWVRAMVTARSSGHCEIMAPGCRYSADNMASRVHGLAVRHAEAPALIYMVCGRCEDTLTHVDGPIARRLGYLLDSPSQAASAPFYWRQSRWHLLDEVGGLREAAAA